MNSLRKKRYPVLTVKGLRHLASEMEKAGQTKRAAELRRQANEKEAAARERLRRREAVDAAVMSTAQQPEGASEMKNPDTEVMRSLRRKMREIAVVAILHDVPAQALNQLMRDAMVDEAAVHPAGRKNGKVQKARISALTGLTRKDVHARCVARDDRAALPPSRIQAVVKGWRARYRRTRLDRKEFDALVQKHAHDVPPRAVLEVMRWRGYVTLVGHDVVLIESGCKF